MRRLVDALAVWTSLAGCSGSPETSDHEAGRRIYNFRCYFCHGYSGDARTLAASMLEPAPRDFTRAARLDEQRAAQAVRSGIPGTAMASFAGTLSPREIEQVARFVVAEFVRARAEHALSHRAERLAGARALQRRLPVRDGRNPARSRRSIAR